MAKSVKRQITRTTRYGVREYFECLEAVEDEAKRLRRSEDSFGSVHDLFRDEAQFGDYYGVTPKFLK